jgi:hypothetical protein
MNTKPDDELLALWLEDELEGEERLEVEAWIAGREDWIAWRRETREWKHLLRSALPSEQAPPACEFFEARIEQMVREENPARRPENRAAPRPSRGGSVKFWLPAAAAAGMAVCFWAGTRVVSPGVSAPVPAPVARQAQPILYTPEQGVKARAFQSEDAQAMVIVLDGVAAIPDSEEITAGSKNPRKGGTGMADAAGEPEEKIQ